MGEKTITEIVEDVAEAICDKYCKYPGQYKDRYKDIDEPMEIMWNEVCDRCPLNKLR